MARWQALTAAGEVATTIRRSKPALRAFDKFLRMSDLPVSISMAIRCPGRSASRSTQRHPEWGARWSSHNRACRTARRPS